VIERKSILVVDDQAGIRALLAEALGQAGYSVQSAASGPEALQCLDQHLPGLVLLDMNMPGMSGSETLKRLRRLHPELPVLMITADDNDKSASRIMELGISGWISKPFLLEDLYRQVEVAID